MARLRYDNSFGTLGANQGIADTTITFAAPLTYADGIQVPTVTGGNTIDITVEPNSTNFEVERITAYTQGALTATVTRGISGSPKAHQTGVTYGHNPTAIGDFNGGTPNLALGTTNAAGTSGTPFDAASAIAVFDTTAPVTQNYSDVAATGAAAVAARRDHKHGMPAAAGGVGVFGDGSDGTVTFDGTTTILGMVPSANTYTVTRDLFLASATINTGVTVATANFRIYISGTLTNNGTISNNGASGSGQTGGAPLAGQTLAISGAGTNGASAGGNGGNGGNVGTSLGGAGGAGGSGDRTGGSGGVVTGLTASSGSVRALPFAAVGAVLTANASTTGAITPLQGGGGGGGGGGGTPNGNGGGGGAGGGVMVIAAKTIAGTGAIRARGGTGGSSIGLANNPGGGGGGGGGTVIVISGSVSGGAVAGQTIDANGGAGGAGQGTGATGSAGSAGSVVLVPN